MGRRQGAGLVIAIAVASIGSQALAQQPSVAVGHELVQRACSGCHAIGREGQSPRKGAPTFRSLDRRYSMGVLEEELRAGMLTGHPPMPPFAFSQGQIGDIMAYLRSIQSGRRIAGASPDKKRPVV